MNTDSHIQALVAMGLTSLEAEIYTQLLKTSPLTGYAIAKALGKPAANVYKAIESLAGKGAIAMDEGDTRLCSPVAAGEFLSRLERDFARHRSDAEDVLSRLPGPGADTRIYQVRSREQVFEHSRRLLRDAEQLVFVDSYPDPLKALSADIEAAAQRGLRVVVKTYADVVIPGVEVLVEPERDGLHERWPVNWLNVVMDGSEYILALLSKDGSQVIQAMWSSSPYLAYVHQYRLACELAYTAIKRGILAGAPHDRLLETFEHTRSLFPVDNPGYHRVMKQIEPFQPIENKEEIKS